MTLACGAGGIMCFAWVIQLVGKRKECQKIEEIYYKNKKEIAKIQKKGLTKEEQALINHYRGQYAPPPEKTPDRIEFVGKETLEFYTIGDREIVRAITEEGKDLGMEFNSITGAVLALEKAKLQ